MSVMRRRRLERLEKIFAKASTPYVDISDWAVPFLQAVLEGRPYSTLPKPDVERTEAGEQAYRRCMQEVDRIAARLEQSDPGAAARFRAERERRLAATIKALEREQEARRCAGRPRLWLAIVQLRAVAPPPITRPLAGPGLFTSPIIAAGGTVSRPRRRRGAVASRW